MQRETNMEMQGHTGLITDTETKTEWMTALFLHKRAIRKAQETTIKLKQEVTVSN